MNIRLALSLVATAAVLSLAGCAAGGDLAGADQSSLAKKDKSKDDDAKSGDSSSTDDDSKSGDSSSTDDDSKSGDSSSTDDDSDSRDDDSDSRDDDSDSKDDDSKSKDDDSSCDHGDGGDGSTATITASDDALFAVKTECAEVNLFDNDVTSDGAVPELDGADPYDTLPDYVTIDADGTAVFCMPEDLDFVDESIRYTACHPDSGACADAYLSVLGS